MSSSSSPLGILVNAYDTWVASTSPDPETSKHVLFCLREAAVEGRRRGEKLLSIPTLLRELDTIPKPRLLPQLSPESLLDNK
jgi:hypothetical protein